MNNIKHVLFTLLFGIFPLVGLTQEASIFINTALNKNDFNASNIQWRITSEHTSSTSDIHHVYFQQVIEGSRKPRNIPHMQLSISFHIHQNFQY